MFYQITRDHQETRQINISNQSFLIKQLAEKKIYKKLLRIYRNNTRALRQFLSKYQPLDPTVLFTENLRQILIEPVQMPDNYERCPFDPLVHIHETICGILVRSKSEVIIANALWHYGIPFHYEEKFHTFDGDYFFPDFTIHLPDGSIIIWEHLGLLNKMQYCEKTAKKLYYLQLSHYTIGKNLILTQDNWQGSCDSENIYHIIETYILPHFTR